MKYVRLCACPSSAHLFSFFDIFEKKNELSKCRRKLLRNTKAFNDGFKSNIFNQDTSHLITWFYHIFKRMAYFPFEIKLLKCSTATLELETKMELFNEQVVKQLN